MQGRGKPLLAVARRRRWRQWSSWWGGCGLACRSTAEAMSYDSCEVKPAGKGADLSGGAYLRWQNSEFRVYKQLTIGPAQAAGRGNWHGQLTGAAHGSFG